MTHSEQDAPHQEDPWAEFGRAANDFARRVARDAGRFAERLQEHSAELADDLSRQWRRSRHRHRRHAVRPTTQDDVRQVFEDVRELVVGVLEGIDELITTVFPPPTDAKPSGWEKVVSNRDVVCSACSRTVSIGEDAYLSRRDGSVEYRCHACGSEAQGA